MPKLTIDGKELEVEAGMTVIQAAAAAGIVVPHYCWHPGLTVAGNCRMCLVEIEKMPKLAIACSTAAAEGMVVRTTVDRVREARDAVMEFLLINHPLDCPICDQAGECRLQQYSFQYGPGGSRFLEEKVHKPKNVDIGRHIVFDAERCIICTRCVRFCKEVSKTDELTVANRGDHVTIETYSGMRLDNAYSGNTVDICPVGALTLKEFRFKQRVWFLKDVRSVCAGCARGCNVDDGISGGKILRMTPRTNPDVNHWWICDDGRLSYQKLYGGGRILRPRVSPEITAAKPVSQTELTTAAAARPLFEREPPASVEPAEVLRETVTSYSPDSNEPVPAALRSGRALHLGETGMGLALDADAHLPQARARGAAPTAGPAGFLSETVGSYIPAPNEGVPAAPRSGQPLHPGETVMGLALDAAARVLREALESGGPGSVEFVFSARATNEDIFLLGKLARERFGVSHAALPVHERGEDDDILIRKDKTPNRAGALAILASLGLTVESGSDLTVRVGSGGVKALVAIGPNLMGMDIPPAPAATKEERHTGGAERRYTFGERGLFEALAVATEATGTLLVVIDAFESPLTARATVVLPALSYGEIEGTFTNFEGRVQRVRAGLPPGADGLPVYRIAQEIGRRLGDAPGRTGAQETFAVLASEIHAFKDLAYARVGDLGALLARETGRP